MVNITAQSITACTWFLKPTSTSISNPATAAPSSIKKTGWSPSTPIMLDDMSNRANKATTIARPLGSIVTGAEPVGVVDMLGVAEVEDEAAEDGIC
jgi:hypothetical protein